VQHGDRDATLQSTISQADSSAICVGKMKITQLKIELQTQSRVAINQDAVAEYADAMMDGERFPPVTAFYDGKEYYLADGYHRYFAAKKAGLDEIDCDVKNGTLRDAVLFSVGVNSAHGLRRNNEDKRKAVMTILDDVEWAEWSDITIAKKCQVTGAFVGRVRKTLNLESTARKYVNQHGQVVAIETTNRGRPTESMPPEVMPLDDEDDIENDHHVQELSDANVELAEENTLLKDRLAVAAFEATPEEKVQLSETMEQLRATIKTQEAEIVALKSSRDTLQQKNADMLKLLAYWKKRAEQAA
jgi:hypothetical protein